MRKNADLETETETGKREAEKKTNGGCEGVLRATARNTDEGSGGKARRRSEAQPTRGGTSAEDENVKKETKRLEKLKQMDQ